jgi:hypothetical protein
VKRVVVAAIAAALILPFGRSAFAQSKTVTGETKTVTATIEAIEQSSRSVTLKKDDGEYVTVVAPREVTKFNQMKVGDKLTIKYYENIVLRLKKPGEKDVDADSAALTPSTNVKPGATAATQRTITATITQLDPAIPSITFTGPNGWKYSSKVQDKEAIKSVKVGDKVDITWTEAMLISVDAPSK